MTFCTVELASQIEYAESELLRAACEVVERRVAAALTARIGSGFGAFTEDGSPLNKVAGLGFGAFDEAAFKDFEQAVLARGARVQVELATLADPALATWLTRRGYLHVGVENLLGMTLPRVAAMGSRTNEVEVARSDDGEFENWLDTVSIGFAAPDIEGVPTHESFESETLKRVIRDFASSAGLVRYLARIGRVVAGGASLRLSSPVAQLCGASTLPKLRRRGVQSALLERRLDEAAAAGCALATMTVQPGSRSGRNAHTRGFQLLYARNVFVREAQPS